jgi:Ca2+-binding EF-hand superfamily protein
MARRFKIMDDDRSGSLSFTEFRKGLKECQVGITEMQIKHIFNLFDRDDNDSVGYEEFQDRGRFPASRN